MTGLSILLAKVATSTSTRPTRPPTITNSGARPVLAEVSA
ncbi:Uncharacterised protein [Mycobacteroides abscessus subsp. abscessus]|nr:Uncharacterised protein [Mycobacteroides abscessus subsp. abscessus]